MGSSTSNCRNIGPWSIKEAIELFKTVCLATEAPEKVFKEDVQIIYDESNAQELLRVKDSKITIYQPLRVSID